MVKPERNRKTHAGSPQVLIAERLYVFEGLTVEEVSVSLDVPISTIRNWQSEGKWASRRAAVQVTPEKINAGIYAAMLQIIETAADAKRILSKEETKQLSDLSSTVEKTQKKLTATMYVSVLTRFTKYLLDRDSELAKKLTVFQREFLNIIFEQQL